MRVREIKEQFKTRALAQPDLLEAMVFDLQQVIYLPKSEHGEIFYKRRLFCYNFTVFELATKTVTCYVHHEVQARRGSNEISSNLFNHLKKFDNSYFAPCKIRTPSFLQCCSILSLTPNPSKQSHFNFSLPITDRNRATLCIVP